MFDVLIFLVVLLSVYLNAFYVDAKKQAMHYQSLTERLLKIELQSLKSQLNPHFLFNTLNTIACLIQLDRRGCAAQAINELSFMLRRVLENDKVQLTSIEQEVEFIRSYLAIQKIRFANTLTVSIKVDKQCLVVDVPFMLLQPLVENAIQHGAQCTGERNDVHISIFIENNELHVQLVNKIPVKDVHHGFGIGVKNCRERLRKLYQSNFQLRLSPISGRCFETYLRIPIGERDDRRIGCG